MASEMQAAVDALNTRCDGLADVINMVARNVAKMGGDPYAPLDLMQARAPTEDQIVAALKADPAMAGRVIGELVKTLGDNQRKELADAAAATVDGEGGWSFFRALQSLAVALAAASYRG